MSPEPPAVSRGTVARVHSSFRVRAKSRIKCNAGLRCRFPAFRRADVALGKPQIAKPYQYRAKHGAWRNTRQSMDASGRFGGRARIAPIAVVLQATGDTFVHGRARQVQEQAQWMRRDRIDAVAPGPSLDIRRSAPDTARIGREHEFYVRDEKRSQRADAIPAFRAAEHLGVEKLLESPPRRSMQMASAVRASTHVSRPTLDQSEKILCQGRPLFPRPCRRPPQRSSIETARSEGFLTRTRGLDRAV
jgi:hypothetical protein